MCIHGGGMPDGYAEALAMLGSGLDYLSAAAESGELAEAVLGEVLLGLEAVSAKQAAARSAVLSRFDAGGCHDSDAYQNSSSWLRDRAGMTQPAARRQVRQMRVLRARPRLAAALGEGWLSESYLDKITVWTKPVPDDMLDFTDQMILSVLKAGGDLDDACKVIAAITGSAHAQDQRDPGPGDPDDDFDDRSLRLDMTLDGAGVLAGNLTPEAAVALQAVLESLGKRKGREDTRTRGQRDHDALLDACRRLLRSRTLPTRAGSDTRAEVHIPFSELVNLPGAERLTDAWLNGTAGQPGWLLGKDAETAACDALIAPVVMASPDWAVITEMAALALDLLGAHEPAAPARDDERASGPGGSGGRADGTAPAAGLARRPAWMTPDEWQEFLRAMGRLAIKFVSGPGAIASLLRTGLLPDPFAGKSVPLDVGYSDYIPEPIRRAVIARAGGYCEWPGGCDVPAAGCDVHHVEPKKDGGPTSLGKCFLGCQFHHDIVIHRWNWTLQLQADGTFTARSPDGEQVIDGHPLRGPRRPPGGGRPPPVRAA